MAWNVDCVCDRSRQANVAQRRECDYTSERRVTISLRSPLLHSSSLILPSHCGSRGNIRDYYTRWRSLLMVFVDVRWRSLLMIVNCAWQFSRFYDFLKSVELFRKLQSLRSLRQSCLSQIWHECFLPKVITPVFFFICCLGWSLASWRCSKSQFCLKFSQNPQT